MPRTKDQTRATDTTQGALFKAARIARELATRLERGAEYLRTSRSADGGRLTVKPHHETFATETRDALRALLRQADTPV